MIHQIAKKFFSFSAKSVPIRQTQLLIDGKFVNSVSGKTFDTIHPATEEKISSVSEGNKEDVNRAVKAARRAFDSGPWSKLNGYERSRLINKLADLMEANRSELAALETLDNGKPYNDSYNIDVPLAIQHMRYFAGWADKIQGTVYSVPGHLCYTREEPVGVVGGIIAWNFPLVLLCWKLGPILATGCTAVIKPAEQTPLHALRLGELIMEAGFPEGVVNVITGYGEAGRAIVDHPGVDKISFTGSTEVGREILSRSASPNIKRVTLELGGKSPNIILNDANVDQAVDQSQFALFFNQGQCCIAGSRTFVQSKIYDEFVEKSARAAQKRILGDPFDKNTSQGPQVDKIQQEKVLSYIQAGKQDGAKMILGGNQHRGKGYFVNPTIFTDVKDDMKIAREEIFGPVMSILKFDTIDEVIQRANDSNYGLGAGVVSQNVEDILRLANGIRAGTVYANTYDIFTPQTPFGGFKDSGLGREHGQHGLRPYLETKTVIIRAPNSGNY